MKKENRERTKNYTLKIKKSYKRKQRNKKRRKNRKIKEKYKKLAEKSFKYKTFYLLMRSICSGGLY